MKVVELINMREKNRLELLIEEKLQNADPNDIGKAIYICKSSDVLPEEILSTDNITVIDGAVYSYGPKTTEIHQYVIHIIMMEIYNSIFQMAGPEWGFVSGAMPIVNIYNCGACKYKCPDGVINETDNCNNIIITMEMAFTHESAKELFYELIHQLSEYTTPTYAIGVEINPNSEFFEMIFIVLKRTTKTDQSKIEYLESLLDNNIADTNLCIKRKPINSVDDIIPENFNVEVIYFKVTNDSNLNEPLEFNLDGAVIDKPGEQIHIHVSADKLQRIKELWIKYKLHRKNK